MTVKKNLLLKILGVEILAIFLGWVLREESRQIYFDMGLIPPLPFWFYDLAAPVFLAITLGFCLGLAVFLNDYWGQVEQRQRLQQIRERSGRYE